MSRLNKFQKTSLGDLSTNNKFLALGLALSGIAAYTSTYDFISSITSEYKKCNNMSDLKDKLRNKFIITLVLCSVAVVVAIVLFVLMNSRDWTFIKSSPFVPGLLIIGLFGIVYALFEKYSTISSIINVVISWVVLIVFIMLGFRSATNQE